MVMVIFVRVMEVQIQISGFSWQEFDEVLYDTDVILLWFCCVTLLHYSAISWHVYEIDIVI